MDLCVRLSEAPINNQFNAIIYQTVKRKNREHLLKHTNIHITRESIKCSHVANVKIALNQEKWQKINIVSLDTHLHISTYKNFIIPHS